MRPRQRLDAAGEGAGKVLRVDGVAQGMGGDRLHIHTSAGWFAHAPSRVVYDIPADLHAVTIGYVLPKNAYEDENGKRRSDGIGALVEFVDPNNEVTTLYRRQIDPHAIAEDRGLITARVELPGRSGRLIVRLTPGAQGSASYDWSYMASEFIGEVAPPSPSASAPSVP